MHHRLSSRVPTRRLGAFLAVGAVLVSTAGCGGSDEPAEQPEARSSSSATASASPEESPSASPSENPLAPSSTPPNMPKIKGAKVVPIPTEGPTEAVGFPVPPWVKTIKSPGALDQSWQFDIPTKDTDRVIAFYKKVLPRGGYKIRTDVEENLADEIVHWDIVFNGPCDGTIVADKEAGTVFVEARANQGVG